MSVPSALFLFEAGRGPRHCHLQPCTDHEGTQHYQQFQGLHAATDWQSDQGFGASVLSGYRLVEIFWL